MCAHSYEVYGKELNPLVNGRTFVNSQKETAISVDFALKSIAKGKRGSSVFVYLVERSYVLRFNRLYLCLNALRRSPSYTVGLFVVF